VTVLCAHFGSCGGCTYQDMPDAAYRAMKRDGVLAALATHGLSDVTVAEAVEASPATRRRATLKVEKREGRTLIGFHAARSHTIVDLEECRVMTSALTALVAGLRGMMQAILHEGEKTELHVTATDTGPDLVLRWKRLVSPALTAHLANWAGRLGIARITAGAETLIEMQVPSIRIGRATVKLPPDAFLQATAEGEAALVAHVTAHLSDAKSVCDLFCGCGTFALPLAERARVHAVELDGAMLSALGAATRTTPGLKPVTTEKRDLFKRPLAATELARFDGVVLDPPRAGALAQARALAQSRIPRIAYVSCNPASFARDARLLVDGGYRMGPVTPVDQFLWSSHIELVAGFARAGRRT
jgi:23S rRNA (uracil1939-C5)-methyltransferase